MADVKWIKLVVNVFNNRKIEQIEVMPEGDGIIVIWFKFLCLAGGINDEGTIYFTKEIPYTEEMLSTQFHRPLALIKLALRVFVQFGMIEIINDVIHISNWEKYQNTDSMQKIREQGRVRVARFREKQKLTDGNATVTLGNATDIDTDIEEDTDKNKNKKSTSTPKHQYGMYSNVLLSDDDHAKLKAEFPDWAARVDRLSEGIETKGYKYKNHLATIRAWARKDGENGRSGQLAGPGAGRDESASLHSKYNGIIC